MIQAGALNLTYSALPLRAVEAFPASLSVVRLAGLENHLDQETAARLRGIERDLSAAVNFNPILLARSPQDFEQAVGKAISLALDYYEEAGAIIWRGLGHDYQKLVRLARVSREAIEDELFKNYKRLKRDTVVKTVAAMRTLGKVGEWITKAEERKELRQRSPPFDYLMLVIGATFITQCLLSYATGEAKRAKRSSLTELAMELGRLAVSAYQEALKEQLPTGTEQEQQWYWSPSWQEGEAAADLDRYLGDVRRFPSAESLVRYG